MNRYGQFLGAITLGRALPVEPTHHSGAAHMPVPVTTDCAVRPTRTPASIERAREITTIDERPRFD